MRVLAWRADAARRLEAAGSPDPAADALRAKLRAIDLNVLTPIEAMNKLYELCEEANRS